MDEIKKAIEDLANWYYRLKPQGGEIEERIKACNSRDELNSLKDDISKTKDSSLYTAFNEKIIELAAREGLTK